jgi:hypothetical protein
MDSFGSADFQTKVPFHNQNSTLSKKVFLAKNFKVVFQVGEKNLETLLFLKQQIIIFTSFTSKDNSEKNIFYFQT